MFLELRTIIKLFMCSSLQNYYGDITIISNKRFALELHITIKLFMFSLLLKLYGDNFQQAYGSRALHC